MNKDVDQITDITEYLPFYLNQPCECNIPGAMVQNYGHLTINELTPENLFTVLYNLQQKNKGIFDYQHYYCKPKLRQILDMTKSEAMEVLKMLYDWEIVDPKFGYQPYDITWCEDAREFIYMNFRGYAFGGEKLYDLKLEIDSNFACSLILFRGSVDNVTSCNQHKITKYLIEQGFDVFGLIKQGLATKISYK
jgi:hypothetical protein